MALGRPREYDPEFHPETARKLCLLGYTDKQLAKSFSISESTLNRWKKEFQEFWESVHIGKELADAEIADSLYKRAKGFEIDGEKLLTVAQGDGVSEVERHAIKVYFPPDAGAALNWLKNRQPALWRDKQDVSLSGEITVTLNLDGETKQTEE